MQDSSNREMRVGTLLQMCPRSEFNNRILYKSISPYERDANGEPDYTRAVKQYHRSAAGTENDDSLARPDHILLYTLDYLITNILHDVDNDFHVVHVFMADRLRGIRSDYKYQLTTSIGFALQLEVQIRYTILSSYLLVDQEYDFYQPKLNSNALRNQFEELLHLYHEVGISTGNEAEFYAYHIIFHKDPTALLAVPRAYYNTTIFQAAVYASKCIKTLNFSGLYKLLLSPHCPLLLACFIVSQDLAEFNYQSIKSIFKSANNHLDEPNQTQSLIHYMQTCLHLRKSDIAEYLLCADKNPFFIKHDLTPDIVAKFGLDPSHKIVVRGAAGHKVDTPARPAMNLPPKPSARRIHTLNERIKVLTPLFLVMHDYMERDAVILPLMKHYEAGAFGYDTTQCFPRVTKLLYPNIPSKQLVSHITNINNNTTVHQQYLTNWVNKMKNVWRIILPDVQPLPIMPDHFFQYDSNDIGVWTGDSDALWKPPTTTTSAGQSLLALPISKQPQQTRSLTINPTTTHPSSTITKTSTKPLAPPPTTTTTTTTAGKTTTISSGMSASFSPYNKPGTTTTTTTAAKSTQPTSQTNKAAISQHLQPNNDPLAPVKQITLKRNKDQENITTNKHIDNLTIKSTSNASTFTQTPQSHTAPPPSPYGMPPVLTYDALITPFLNFNTRKLEETAGINNVQNNTSHVNTTDKQAVPKPKLTQLFTLPLNVQTILDKSVPNSETNILQRILLSRARLRVIVVWYQNNLARQEQKRAAVEESVRKQKLLELEKQRQLIGMREICNITTQKIHTIQVTNAITTLAQSLNERAQLKELAMKILLVPWLTKWKQNTQAKIIARQERKMRLEIFNSYSNNAVKRLLFHQYAHEFEQSDTDDEDTDDERARIPLWARQFRDQQKYKLEQSLISSPQQYPENLHYDSNDHKMDGGEQDDGSFTDHSSSLQTNQLLNNRDEEDDDLPSYETVREFEIIHRKLQRRTMSTLLGHSSNDDDGGLDLDDELNNFDDIDLDLSGDDSDNDDDDASMSMRTNIYTNDVDIFSSDDEDENQDTGDVYHDDNQEENQTNDLSVQQHQQSTRYLTAHPLYNQSKLISHQDKYKFHEKLDLIENFLHLQHLFVTPLNQFTYINTHSLVSTLMIGYLLQFKRILHLYSQHLYLTLLNQISTIYTAIQTVHLPYLQHIIQTISIQSNNNNNNNNNNNDHSTINSSFNLHTIQQKKQPLPIAPTTPTIPTPITLQNYLSTFAPRGKLFPTAIYPIHVVTATYQQDNLKAYVDSLNTANPGVVKSMDLPNNNVRFDEGALQLLLSTNTIFNLSHEYPNSTQFYQYSLSLTPLDTYNNNHFDNSTGNDVFPLVELQPLDASNSISTNHSTKKVPLPPNPIHTTTCLIDNHDILESMFEEFETRAIHTDEMMQNNDVDGLETYYETNDPTPLTRSPFFSPQFGNYTPDRNNSSTPMISETTPCSNNTTTGITNDTFTLPPSLQHSHDQNSHNQNHSNENTDDDTYQSYDAQCCELSFAPTNIYVQDPTYNNLLTQLPQLISKINNSTHQTPDTDVSNQSSRPPNHSIITPKPPQTAPICCFNTRLTYDELIIKGINIVPVSISLNTDYINKIYHATKHFNITVRHLYTTCYIEQLLTYERKKIEWQKVHHRTRHGTQGTPAYSPPPAFIYTKQLDAQLNHLRKGFLQFLDKCTSQHFTSIIPIFSALHNVVHNIHDCLLQDQIAELTLQHQQQLKMDFFYNQIDAINEKINRYQDICQTDHMSNTSDSHDPFSGDTTPINTSINTPFSTTIQNVPTPHPSRQLFNLQLLQHEINNTLAMANELNMTTNIDNFNATLSTSPPQSPSTSDPNSPFSIDPITQTDINALALDNVVHESPRLLILLTLHPHTAIWIEQFCDFYNNAQSKHESSFSKHKLLGTLPFNGSDWGNIGTITHPHEDINNKETMGFFAATSSTAATSSNTHVNNLLSTESKIALVSHNAVETMVEPTLASIFDIVQASAYRVLWGQHALDSKMNDDETSTTSVSTDSIKTTKYDETLLTTNFNSECIVLCTSSNNLIQATAQDNPSDLNDLVSSGDDNNACIASMGLTRKVETALNWFYQTLEPTIVFPSVQLPDTLIKKPNFIGDSDPSFDHQQDLNSTENTIPSPFHPLHDTSLIYTHIASPQKNQNDFSFVATTNSNTTWDTPTHGIDTPHVSTQSNDKINKTFTDATINTTNMHIDSILSNSSPSIDQPVDEHLDTTTITASIQSTANNTTFIPLNPVSTNVDKNDPNYVIAEAKRSLEALLHKSEAISFQFNPPTSSSSALNSTFLNTTANNTVSDPLQLNSILPQHDFNTSFNTSINKENSIIPTTVTTTPAKPRSRPNDVNSTFASLISTLPQYESILSPNKNNNSSGLDNSLQCITIPSQQPPTYNTHTTSVHNADHNHPFYFNQTVRQDHRNDTTSNSLLTNSNVHLLVGEYGLKSQHLQEHK